MRKPKGAIKHPIDNRGWTEDFLYSIPNLNTRRNYQSVLNTLKGHFPSVTGKESAKDLLLYVRALQTNGMAPQSLRGHVSILRNLYSEFARRGIRRDNPVTHGWCPKVKIHTKPRCPDKPELDRLDKVLSEVEGFVGSRDRAIIGFMKFEGFRIFEVQNIKYEGLERQGGKWLLKVHGKGGFVTTVELWPQTIKLLNEYFEYIPRKYRHGSIFIPEFKPGKKMDVRTIRKRCDQYFRQSKWRKGLSPHSLRHALAVTLLENGVPLTDVQRKLRHRFLATTFWYYSDVQSMRSAQAIKDAPKLIDLKF